MITIPKPQIILTDIEGTTTSISFVSEVLFPYFRENLHHLENLLDHPEVILALEETKKICKDDGLVLSSNQDVFETLFEWSLADRKITPLKTVQGILWKIGYENGELKGHVYPDVKRNLQKWSSENIQLAVFSSGSVAAQKLIFGYGIDGDLTPFFSAYFDTQTGGKRDASTYHKIAESLLTNSSEILFLSDIFEELEAADQAGFKTIQLLREGTTQNWKLAVSSFDEVAFLKKEI